MKQKLLYIELKSGSADCGPAWIGLAAMSKSGRTVYFNGRALKRSVGGGISGNHYCIETGDEFWVSGPKKDGHDRHWAGGGVILIAADAVTEYLSIRGLYELDHKLHRVSQDVLATDIKKFSDIENQAL